MFIHTIGIVIVLVVLLIASMFRVLREYERAVVFFLGRFYDVKGPGLIIIIPFIQQMVRVDLRTIVLDVPTQDLITRDNVSVKVNAVVYFRVLDPKMAINNVENYLEATSQLSQTTLRSVLGQHELDELLSEREELNRDLQSILDQHTDNGGIKIANVEIKHVDLDFRMLQKVPNHREAPLRRGGPCEGAPTHPSDLVHVDLRSLQQGSQHPESAESHRFCQRSSQLTVLEVHVNGGAGH